MPFGPCDSINRVQRFTPIAICPPALAARQRPVIVATAGHVDHGKTTLVRALTGIDTDRLPEEKARGLTIDLGFAYQPLDNDAMLGFVDVPGHEKFVRNMLAGVSGIDLGLLVVAADDGIMPQTLEHFAILRLLGIQHYVVAITRIDRADPVRRQTVTGELRQLLVQHGYADVPVFPVCAPQNRGVDALAVELRRRARSLPGHGAAGYFRLPIDRAFTLKGVGLVVTGMVAAGETRVDDRLCLSNGGTPLRVRGIRVHDAPAERARAGERCAIHVGGRAIDEAALRRGDWLLHPAVFAPTQRIDVDLAVLASEPRALKHWSAVHLHLASDRLSARVAVLEGGGIAPGERGLAQLVLERDAFALHGDRFVLRDQSAKRTLGGGRVIDPFAPKRGRARPDRIALLQAMRHDDSAQALEAVAASSATGVSITAFTLARNLAAADVEALLAKPLLYRVGGEASARVFEATRWQRLLTEIVQAVAAFHETRPDSPGASSRDLQLALTPYHDLAIVEAALDELVADKRLARRGSRVHHPSHSVQVSDADRQLWSLAEPYLAPATGSPLSLRQAAEALRIDPSIMEKSLKRGARAGVMVQLTRNRYAPAAYVADLARAAATLADSADGGFSVAEYCKRTETGRNFAIDLLEYFDRLGFTERHGNQRRVRRPAAGLFAPADHA